MRILLADDQPKVRFALRVLLKRHPEWIVVGESADVEELAAQLATTEPDAVILDWHLPGLHDLGSIQALRALLAKLCVIVLSGRPELRQAAIDAGADAFISKIDPPESLLVAITRCQAELEDVHSEVEVS